MNDDYLWNGSGEPDPEVERLERLLRPLGHAGGPLRFPRKPARSRWPRALAAAAALALAAAAGINWARIRPARSWRVVALSDRVNAAAGSGLPPGQWLETDSESRLLLEAGDIGRFVVEPGSRLRRSAATLTDQRLALARGKIHAEISAPPRLVSVDTPSATTLDLGCEYDLSVAPDGTTRVTVTRGWVEMRGEGRSAIVPAGFVDATRAGGAPGTPWIAGAPPEMVAALERYDSGDAAAIEEILARARPADALSVWHLLARTDGNDRVRVFDALVRLTPLPPGVTREKALALDPDALELWRFEMGTPLLPRRLSPWRAFWSRWARALPR